MTHEVSAVDTAEGLAANLQGWGVVEANAGFGRRHASYRAVQLSHVVEVDDSTEMREPPPGAAYYLWRICYGHSHEVVFTGEDRHFHAGVRAELQVVTGGVNAVAFRHHLEMKAIGRGLEPITEAAIFASARVRSRRGTGLLDLSQSSSTTGGSQTPMV